MKELGAYNHDSLVSPEGKVLRTVAEKDRKTHSTPALPWRPGSVSFQAVCQSFSSCQAGEHYS